MKNIHVLKTSNPSKILKDLVDKTYQFKKEATFGNRLELPLNLYITSDEEIKEGDWVYYLHNSSLHKPSIHKVVKPNYSDYKPYSIHFKSGFGVQEDCKKIILTTDQDLIKDGVQAIDDEFLYWFVKNPSCESVEVENSPFYEDNDYKKYKIIIPKEEYKKQTIEGILETLDTKQLGELNIFLKGMERKETQNKELYDDLVDLLERLRPIYKEVTDLHWKYGQKILDSNKHFIKNKSDFELNNLMVEFDDYEFEESTSTSIENELIKEAKKVWEESHPNPIEMALFGAKWQQEQDKNKYSEEEPKLTLDLTKAEARGLLTCILRTSAKGTDLDVGEMIEDKLYEWLEQFKKK